MSVYALMGVAHHEQVVRPGRHQGTQQTQVTRAEVLDLISQHRTVRNSIGMELE